jgi:peptidoglycan/LPS O-acetylase OafA/YrhL
MDRQALAARILKIDGILLLVVAAVHLAATPLVLNFIAGQSTPDTYAQIKPPFLLSFVMGGILLIPLGLSTFFCADSMRRGETWARTICRFNAVTVLMLPLALVLTMPSRYFHAIPFLVAAVLVCIVALSMSAPLALSRANRLSSNIPPRIPPQRRPA